MIKIKKSFDKINTQNVSDILCMYYNKFTFREISDTLQVSDRAVRRVLKNNGIETRRKNRYIIRSEYFDKINTENKAYLLGLIYADGFVGDSYYNNISIGLNISDKNMVDFITSEIVVFGLTPRISKDKNLYVLNFSDKHMATTLRDKFQMSNNKSLELKTILKYVPNNLKSHTLRGYFDGDGAVFNRYTQSTFKKLDGNISKYSYEYKGISICCTPSVAIEIQNFLGMGHIITTKNSNFVVYYNIYNQKEIKSFYKTLYCDSNIYLKRKKDKFIKMGNY